jgi:hypothetical protein
MKRISVLFHKIQTKIAHLTYSPFMRVILFIPPIAIGLMLLILVIVFFRLPPVVPLYYSRPWGEEQLVHPAVLLLLPFSSIFWFLFAIGIIHLFAYRYRVFAQLLFVTQTVSSLAMLYILLRIILLVL